MSFKLSEVSFIEPDGKIIQEEVVVIKKHFDSDVNLDYKPYSLVLSNKEVGTYIRMAELMSTLSNRGTKIGSIAIDYHRRIVGSGFNHNPPGVPPDREAKCKDKAIHAEVDCLSSCDPKEPKVLFVWGLAPCKGCMKVSMMNKVEHIYYQKTYTDKHLDFWQKETFDYINYLKGTQK